MNAIRTLGTIEDPLAIAKAVDYTVKQLDAIGFKVEYLTRPEGLNEARMVIRNTEVTPLFDGSVNDLSKERFFWLKLSSPDIPFAAIQAYRQDTVETTLADWSLNFIIGTYMRRGAIMVPAFPSIKPTSVSHLIKGNLAYHGEYWIDPRVRNRRVLELFSKLGMVLALIKWNPDYIWALSDKLMATRGHPGRMGFTCMEAAFLQWTWAPESNGDVEWLHYIPRNDIAHVVTELLDYPDVVSTATSAGAKT